MNALTKNLKQLILLTGLILASLTPVYAGDGDTWELSRQIGTQLSFPAGLVQPEFNEKVKVDFRVKEDGSVELIRIHTMNKELREHVIAQFGQMNFNGQNVDTGKIYRIDVKYRVI